LQKYSSNSEKLFPLSLLAQDGKCNTECGDAKQGRLGRKHKLKSAATECQVRFLQQLRLYLWLRFNREHLLFEFRKVSFVPTKLAEWAVSFHKMRG